MSDYQLKLDGGKYIIQYNENPYQFKALRYGKEWRDLTGDNLILALMFQVINYKEKWSELKEYLQREDYEIWKTVDHKTDDRELIRLKGKHEGIGVALSYLNENE